MKTTSLSKTVCHPTVAQAVENLHAALKSNYGSDFSFSVMGRGCKLAASSAENGEILPNPNDFSHNPLILTDFHGTTYYTGKITVPTKIKKLICNMMTADSNSLIRSVKFIREHYRADAKGNISTTAPYLIGLKPAVNYIRSLE